MPIFGRDPKDSIAEIVKDLLDGEEITASEQDIFLRTRFPEIARIASSQLEAAREDYGTRYEGPTFVPTVVSSIHRHAPNFFDNAFVNTPVFYKRFSFVTDFEDMNISEKPYGEFPEDVRRENLRVKKDFNSVLNQNASAVLWRAQKCEDLDVIGSFNFIDEPDRAEYLRMAKIQREAFGTVVRKGGALDICMRVFKEDPDYPYAGNTAAQILRLGGRVWNYGGGEKFIIHELARTLPNWRNLVLGYSPDPRHVEEQTSIKARRYKDTISEKAEPTYGELLALQAYLRRKYTDSDLNLVLRGTETTVIHREVFTGQKPTSEEPQLHRYFDATIFYNYPQMFVPIAEGIRVHIDVESIAGRQIYLANDRPAYANSNNRHSR